MEINSQKVAIAISGGIDSLVSAHLLKQQYSEVFGIYFSTGYEDKTFDLSSIKSQLGMDIKIVDFSSLFETKIVNYFINTYLSGQTPNPCILCNKIIKFGALMESAKSFGADLFATGHYAKIQKNNDSYSILKGKDKFKEQSYFLSSVSGDKLKNILFPLGELTKTEIRKIAQDNHLKPVEKKESQDICFLKNQSIAQFIQLKTEIEQIEGNIITSDNKIIGKHKGLYNFTIGQRRGINCPASQAYYVKKIDAQNNTLLVCFKNELFQHSFRVKSLIWAEDQPEFPIEMLTRIRYNHKPCPATLNKDSDPSILNVTFDHEQFAITPGQTAVFYDKNKIIGSGIII